MKQVIPWNEGDTTPRRFRLTSDGFAEELTQATVTGQCWDRYNVPIDLTGDVSIVDPASGEVELRPDPNDFTAKRSPHRLVFRIQDALGQVGFYPDDEPLEINIRHLP